MREWGITEVLEVCSNHRRWVRKKRIQIPEWLIKQHWVLQRKQSFIIKRQFSVPQTECKIKLRQSFLGRKSNEKDSVFES